ncbi:hypothetical protein PVL29_014474 [Vitis rotundifolia]|uniref:Uncharacterized protein n=1 Tax=Vitis rotundifolia TaxID=103349 RepID=A0AA39DL53_VITRO|nr:hypothetical protein PVL29_014474 [Vitis rotundifolia]
MREKRKPQQTWWSLLTFIARVSRVGAQRLTRGGEAKEDREDHKVPEEEEGRGREVVDQGAEGETYLADPGVEGETYLADPGVEGETYLADPGVADPGAAVRSGTGRMVASSLLLLQGCCGVAKGLEGACQFIM